ncbi:hypothetical protein CF327_g4785 [Tilletia walkeri]|uniref:Uncharacterized protein n=1 Tax=Tilletia walkeri TaxID=117179 RepID=A0A8X7N2T4_9BASI|nr:hypothetical protein CF327_g4785 [Tilletia walkeri]KAE8261502.1 hypothetical protein A4X09_0g7655 [Tilletia walkeri]
MHSTLGHGWSKLEIVEAVLSPDLQSPLSIRWIAFVSVIMRHCGRLPPHRTQTRKQRRRSRDQRHLRQVHQLLHHPLIHPHLDQVVNGDPVVSGLGTTAIHAVVLAQLLIDGKDIGPHLFFVPLRYAEAGKLFSGVNAGDIGPKTYGAFAGLDDNWARFDDYIIPRENMFMKHSQVSKVASTPSLSARRCPTLVSCLSVPKSSTDTDRCPPAASPSPSATPPSVVNSATQTPPPKPTPNAQSSPTHS